MGAKLYERIKNGPWLWFLPMFFMLFVFRFYPLVEAIRLSFTDASMLEPVTNYVGFETYQRIIGGPVFWTIVKNTFIFVFSCIVTQLGLGLIAAVLINRGVKYKLRGTMFVRGSVLVSWIIPGIVIGLIWKMILMEGRYGIANYLLSLIGSDPISFLSMSGPAMISIILANTWRGTAFSMIMQYAALQKIPIQLYEAADIDGASGWQQFLYVTLPQLKNILFVNLVLITIYTFNLFDMILPLTGGGPGRATEVLALNLYRRAFSNFDLSGAATIAVVMLLINLVMSIIYYKFLITDEAK